MKSIMVTGCAGFIGSHVSEKLLSEGYKVVGIDNFDPFYPRKVKEKNMMNFLHHPHFTFYEIDLRDASALNQIEKNVEIIIHLAGKAGVRPSIEDPQSYIENNIIASNNILEYMRSKHIKKMAFASSSSIYGNAKKVPFQEKDKFDNPISPYAFSKKSCELQNFTYHHLYDLDIINLRFFTVYGPRQRPDLAIHKFLSLIRKGEVIPVYSDGTSARDYTYIDLIATIGQIAKAEVLIKRMPNQAGDVSQTYADISYAKKLLGYQPKIKFREGIEKFVSWYDNQ